MVALRWRHRRHRLITWLLFMQWNSQLVARVDDSRILMSLVETISKVSETVCLTPLHDFFLATTNLNRYLPR